MRFPFVSFLSSLELVRSVPAHDLRQLDVYIRGLSLGRGLPVVGDMSMISAIHSDGTPWAGAATHDGVAIDRSIANKHAQYPELVVSQTVEFLVLACEEGGRWGPDVFHLVRDLVALKVAPLHPLLRRSCALAYTRRWWSILAMGAQTAAVDCILNQDSPIPVPKGAPPLADIFHWADIAPEPSRIA